MYFCGSPILKNCRAIPKVLILFPVGKTLIKANSLAFELFEKIYSNELKALGPLGTSPRSKSCQFSWRWDKG